MDHPGILEAIWQMVGAFAHPESTDPFWNQMSILMGILDRYILVTKYIIILVSLFLKASYILFLHFHH
jgi:hypothetical protein